MTEKLHLSLDGYEGPLDLLLELARQQKVDLAQISVLQLAEQFLAVVEEAKREAQLSRLELTADWLVMAAWLTWLKSRLLLPHLEAESEEAAEMLHERLAELEYMKALIKWLENQPQLGVSVFERPISENHNHIDRSCLKAEFSSLIASYLTSRRRTHKKRVYKPRAFNYWSVQKARDILSRLLGQPYSDKWQSLTMLLPTLSELSAIEAKAAIAGAFMAGLEMARSGVLELRQETSFALIEWRGCNDV
ncbi:segregation/condensation protein A [Aristophania vespae]|uniref:Segregation and condensation protein A n=1 Tax=Aristophania vespae TaxID=2697033 RepID=A0A6P1NEL2_9PROT|nr:ScpA family protein [Aristophania vespae]QHI95297.1 segregation/condensation protein A [Aristophania vespae]UMM64552.1 Segregation and condensation protein A [Aristophania vespae]